MCMNQTSLFKSLIVGDIFLFLAAFSIELILCYGVLYLGVSIHAVQIFKWFFFIALTILGLYNVTIRKNHSSDLVFGAFYIFYAVFCFSVTHFIVQPYRFAGQSMESTLFAGDDLIVRRFK